MPFVVEVTNEREVEAENISGPAVDGVPHAGWNGADVDARVGTPPGLAAIDNVDGAISVVVVRGRRGKVEDPVTIHVTGDGHGSAKLVPIAGPDEGGDVLGVRLAEVDQPRQVGASPNNVGRSRVCGAVQRGVGTANEDIVVAITVKISTVNVDSGLGTRARSKDDQPHGWVGCIQQVCGADVASRGIEAAVVNVDNTLIVAISTSSVEDGVPIKRKRERRKDRSELQGEKHKKERKTNKLTRSRRD